MNKLKSNADIRNIIIDKVIKNIEDNQMLPWSKNWNSASPINLYSNKNYSGINSLLLSWNSVPIYFTYNQAKEMNITLIDYKKLYPVVFYKPLYKNSDNKIVSDKIVNEDNKHNYTSIPLLRYFNVYNVDNIKSCSKDIQDKIDKLTIKNESNKSIDNCEQFFKRHYKKDIAIGQPCYIPIQDIIKMPDIKSFNTSDNYYKTLYHELAHFTGHSSRLNRLDIRANFGSKNYSKEELIAELSASKLSSIFKLKCEYDNSIAYIQNWIKALKNDSSILFESFKESEKVIDYLKPTI